jgi:hypothetical protein
MWKALNSELELAIQSGFVYTPLLLDPDIATELIAVQDEGLGGARSEKATIEVNGTVFVKAMNLNSVLDNYEQIDPAGYEQVRKNVLQEHSDILAVSHIFLFRKLKTIIFEIMPYFIRKGRVRGRRRLSEEELLDVIIKRIDVPQRHLKEAAALLDAAPLRRVLKDLEAQAPVVKRLEDGLLSARDLLGWFQRALEARVVECEKERLRQALLERGQFGEKQQCIAMLLYIAKKGSLEIDGFGFTRIGRGDEYLIYKHTGEYILRDYYARPYLFPNCRVAIATNGVIKPIVIERYKHPFLQGHESGQEICMRGFTPRNTFTADNIIEVLEEGVNALLYGYDSRRRNGHYSLDRTTRHVRSVDFDDYRV